MKITMMLADAAQAVGGKLYILGGGWSIAGVGAPTALAIYIQVDWDKANDRQQLLVELLDSDGGAVLNAEGDAIQINGEFEVGRPPGLKPGTPLDFSMAVGLPPLPLEPNNRYEWRLSLNGKSQDDWRVPFSTRADGPVPG